MYLQLRNDYAAFFRAYQELQDKHKIEEDDRAAALIYIVAESLMNEFGRLPYEFKDGIYYLLSCLDDIHTTMAIDDAKQQVDAGVDQEHSASTN
jgi:hypothetical protein